VKIVWVVGGFVGVGGENPSLHEFQVKFVICTSWFICHNYLVIEHLSRPLVFGDMSVGIFMKQTDGTIWEYF
jgi:hypothetical protein